MTENNKPQKLNMVGLLPLSNKKGSHVQFFHQENYKIIQLFQTQIMYKFKTHLKIGCFQEVKVHLKIWTVYAWE